MEEAMREGVKEIIPVRVDLGEVAQRRLDMLTKPRGSLGRLEEFAQRLVMITEDPMPDLGRKVIFIFAGDHGVAEEEVSAYPKEVTRQMVFNFLRGGAGINVLARHAGAEVVVIDIGVEYDFGDLMGLVGKKVVRGTRNMRRGPAMTKAEAEACIRVGIELAAEYAGKGYGIFAAGEMGIANTTPAAAIVAVITGRTVSEVTGRGTGISDDVLKHKIEVIKDSIVLNRPDPGDPIDVLSKVGGAEIGGITGLILGAASRRVPVVIDGFISTAGALIASALEPAAKDYMFAAHKSFEIGHEVMLQEMGLRPVLDLDMRLGEGTGAALAFLMIEAGLKIYKEMATFSDAEISEKRNR
jgi:nicotinate-nucleotide--dimethylbenzimidazole phosphoribosyltransferase